MTGWTFFFTLAFHGVFQLLNVPEKFHISLMAPLVCHVDVADPPGKVLAAQLNDAVGAGHQTVSGYAGGEDLLHKGDLAAVRQAHTGRAGDGQVGFAIGQILGGHFFQQRLAFL